eukprot:SAG31_NODE_10289_length_1160_cov_1.107446_1_plen_126_part_00
MQSGPGVGSGYLPGKLTTVAGAAGAAAAAVHGGTAGPGGSSDSMSEDAKIIWAMQSKFSLPSQQQSVRAPGESAGGVAGRQGGSFASKGIWPGYKCKRCGQEGHHIRFALAHSYIVYDTCDLVIS